MRLTWHTKAQQDRLRIMNFVAEGNPEAAIVLDTEFRDRARRAALRPAIYTPGRYQGTREIVVRLNYVMVYRVTHDSVEILRILHARQRWP
ncbi:addiction module RelE/StbE family toxin [Pseudomonas hunanensis]|uniref:Addiction module RelE/StbE family toxin n=1 Tax=Pseudomonas hunanensis TaxID=1247546 RepID=A0ACC6K1I6_9PSED|nr:type II toxin-antitoxin system RelE/ParE family toxin [Pseudomonas hunanensis]MDR6712314.1 addiction module RelE/StbE family toxin [Pseudomonas hunanensis]